jgi:hypothetical protein
MQCYVDMAAMGKAETIEKVHFCRSEEGGHGEDDDKNETMQDRQDNLTVQHKTEKRDNNKTKQYNTTRPQDKIRLKKDQKIKQKMRQDETI